MNGEFTGQDVTTAFTHYEHLIIRINDESVYLDMGEVMKLFNGEIKIVTKKAKTRTHGIIEIPEEV